MGASLADAGLSVSLFDDVAPATWGTLRDESIDLVQREGGLGVLWIDEGAASLCLYWVDPFDR